MNLPTCRPLFGVMMGSGLPAFFIRLFEFRREYYYNSAHLSSPLLFRGPIFPQVIVVVEDEAPLCFNRLVIQAVSLLNAYCPYVVAMVQHCLNR